MDLLPDNTWIGDERAMNALRLNSLMARKGMIDGGEQITWHRPSIESEEGDRRRYIYTDENELLDCKMPDLLVFLQGSKYEAIKDLCTDGEVPSEAKSLTENCGLDNNIFSRLNSEADSSELPKERSTQSSISNNSNSSIQHDCNDYVVEQCSTRNLEETPEVDVNARDRVSNEGCTERITGEAGSNCSHFESSKPIEHGGGQKCQQVYLHLELLFFTYF